MAHAYFGPGRTALEARATPRIGSSIGSSNVAADSEDLAGENRDSARVLCTGHNLQPVPMSLLRGKERRKEVNESRDQFLRVERGKDEVRIDGGKSKIKKDLAVIAPAGVRHNIVNSGEKSLQLHMIFAHPEYRDGVVHPTDQGGRRRPRRALRPQDLIVTALPEVAR